MRTSVDVHNHLLSMEIRHELVVLSGPVRESRRMAEVLGLEPYCIVKTLIYIADNSPVLVMVPGDRRADKAKLRALLAAKKLVFAEGARVNEITDFFSGSVPPVALKVPMKAFIDKTTASCDVVYASGGEPNVVLKIRASDLVKAAAATVADIAE